MKTSKQSAAVKFISSLIVVEDIAKARFLYEIILGQKIVSDFGENVGFEGGFAIHQKKHFSSLIDAHAILSRSNNFELYFEDDDLETIEKTLIENDFEFIHGVREQPWKQRVLRFYDSDKNIIEIGERMEHVAYRLYLEKTPIADISRITYMSAEKVAQAIADYES